MVKKYPTGILLADDQKDIHLLTTHQLERSGHRVLAVPQWPGTVGSAAA
jgi:CheY-like chemotaxis protein